MIAGRGTTVPAMGVTWWVKKKKKVSGGSLSNCKRKGMFLAFLIDDFPDHENADSVWLFGRS